MKKFLFIILIFWSGNIFATCGKYESCTDECQENGKPKAVGTQCSTKYFPFGSCQEKTTRILEKEPKIVYAYQLACVCDKYCAIDPGGGY